MLDPDGPRGAGPVAAACVSFQRPVFPEDDNGHDALTTLGLSRRKTRKENRGFVFGRNKLALPVILSTLEFIRSRGHCRRT